MTLRLRLAASVVFATLLAGLGFVASAQTPAGRETSAASVASYGLAELMPVDPEVVVGTLPNGLRYYVRANGKPGRRAELRLVVKAGSVLEDEDQKGLAHFVEHMEFEGTRNFPKQGIVDFLTSLGLSIGADANAATSYDDTQYTLGVPTDVPGVLDRALLVLEDWAQGATFDQAGIDRERGIVLAEWRMRLGAGERTQDKIRRAQLEGSRYADRLPIGDTDNIAKFDPALLQKFYTLRMEGSDAAWTLQLAPIDKRLIALKLLDAGEIAWLDAYHARVRDALSPLLDPETKAWLAAATGPLK
jgi:zinc protease